MKSRNAFFYIIIALALLAAVGLIFFLAPGSTPDTPAVVLPSPVPAEAVQESGAGEGGNPLRIGPENVQTALATLSRAESYSRTLMIRDFYSGGSRERSIAVYAKPGALRLDITAENAPTEHVLLSDGEKRLWFDGDSSVYTGPAADSDADAYQSILTYENILSAPKADILAAGFTDFSGVSCIFVRWRFGSLGYESECFIDPDSGLLLGERCYDGQLLIYSMDSELLRPEPPEDSHFTAPERSSSAPMA